MDADHPVFALLQIVLPLALASLLVYLYTDYRTKTTHFVCPLCRNGFKLSKFQFAFAMKTGRFDERIVTCPVCGYRGRMPLVKD